MSAEAGVREGGGGRWSTDLEQLLVRRVHVLRRVEVVLRRCLQLQMVVVLA